jgi:hypothetical protein
MTYKVQIDDEVRDATAEEIERIEAMAAYTAAKEAAINDKATAKAALLAKLGITAEEAALLLG